MGQGRTEGSVQPKSSEQYWNQGADTRAGWHFVLIRAAGVFTIRLARRYNCIQKSLSTKGGPIMHSFNCGAGNVKHIAALNCDKGS